MYAKVIVDISNNEVDRVFDYKLIDGISVGMRVLVPFGPRQIEGYVIALTDKPTFDQSKIKPITRALDQIPVITDEMLRLLNFMRYRYNLRIIDVLRLFIPAQMRGGRIKELTRLFVYISDEFLNKDTAEFIKPSSLAQAELYQFLKSSGGAFLSEITKNYSASAYKNFLDRGVVKTKEQRVGRLPYKSSAEQDIFFALSAEQKKAVDTICAAIPVPSPDQDDNFDSISSENSLSENFNNNNSNKDPFNKNLTKISSQYSFIENSTVSPQKSDEPTHNSAQKKDSFDSIKPDPNKAFVLFGVTGSGKTEVYLRSIEHALNLGKTAIMLVPEISLTPQVFSKFKARFGSKVAILHSGLSAGERFDEWQRLISGEALIAVGARSAIFAPLKNVGIIIIDEEHDSSYSSESNPRYATSSVALFRQKFNDAALVFGSATPSVETFYGAKIGDYTLLQMPNRINNTLPKINIVNMSAQLYAGNNSSLSTFLHQALDECLKNQNQAMLFINRRGYSSFVRCGGCGYVAKCERCDVSLVYHKSDDSVFGQEQNSYYNQQNSCFSQSSEILKCHYCGNRYGKPDTCPSCKAAALRRGFVGTQQVQEKISEIFPQAKTLRMDNDTTQGKDAHLSILSDFRQKKADILIGTQMIAKGHDFPSVTLVGIIDADISLHFSDYKSNERTFQLITQVSGRAGRADKDGSVFLQTYSPNHYVYKFAKENDYLAFYKKEINLREVASFPPFATILRVLLNGEDAEKTAAVLRQIYQKFLSISEQNKRAFAYLAYMHSPVRKIKNQNRMQVLARITNSFDTILQDVYAFVDELRTKKDCKGISIFVEINPSNLS